MMLLALRNLLNLALYLHAMFWFARNAGRLWRKTKAFITTP